MIIPVRVRVDAPLTTVGDARQLRPDHPLYRADCPVCDERLADEPMVLVYIGIPPYDRKESGWTTGSAVAVHAACARVDAPAAQPADAPADAATDLRDRIAAKLRDDLKRRTAQPLTDHMGRPIGGGIGLTEYDLADITMTVVQPELEQLRAQLKDARIGNLTRFLDKHPRAQATHLVDGKLVLDEPFYAVTREFLQTLLDGRTEAAEQQRDAALAVSEAQGAAGRLAEVLREILARCDGSIFRPWSAQGFRVLQVGRDDYDRWRTALDGSPRAVCGATVDQGEIFGITDGITATCTKAPHLPADPWHRDDRHHGFSWRISEDAREVSAAHLYAPHAQAGAE